MDRDTYTEVNGRLSPYCKHNGIFMTELAPGHGVAKKVVTEEDRNALGYAHGAVYFAVADTASGNAVAAYGHTTVTMNSDYHFMRFFKKHMSMTCIEYINNLRLEKSVEQFEQGNTSILDVSLSVGFHNLSYFHRAFKKKYHMTPRSFIKQLQEN